MKCMNLGDKYITIINVNETIQLLDKIVPDWEFQGTSERIEDDLYELFRVKRNNY